MTRPAVRSLLMFLQRASSSGLKHSQIPSPPLTPLAAAAAVLESPPAAAAGLDASAPSAEVLEGSAELLPLPNASVDAVVVAQAFHWFDAVRAEGRLEPGDTVSLHQA